LVTLSSEAGALGIVQALWETKKGDRSLQVRVVLRGAETVLGDAASKDELFVTAKLLTRCDFAVLTRPILVISPLPGINIHGITPHGYRSFLTQDLQQGVKWGGPFTAQDAPVLAS